jgi:fused signal recognition particle receptor
MKMVIRMGLFDKIKKMFTKEEKEPRVEEEKEVKKEEQHEVKKEEKKQEKEEVKIYEKGLSKSRENFVSKLINLTNKYHKITEEYFEELEEVLIMADIGVNTVMDFMDRLRKRVRNEKIEDTEYLKELIVDELFIIYVNDEVIVNKINYSQNKPTVILFVGVNGVGKTTSIAKIAYQLKKEGKKVLLAAGDTFRAGAIEQLATWAKRIGVDIVYKEAGSDPSSVMFDAVNKAKKEGYDVLLCDTAGRLQNKVNLMSELDKIRRVISRELDGAPHETLLTIDATTGQNGMQQAKIFSECCNVSGIILTKLDGTAKGGIVLAIRNELGIPIKYVGLGETLEDLEPFDIEQYLYGLFADFFD